jgi:hypothetical protein
VDLRILQQKSSGCGLSVMPSHKSMKAFKSDRLYVRSKVERSAMTRKVGTKSEFFPDQTGYSVLSDLKYILNSIIKKLYVNLSEENDLHCLVNISQQV